MSKSSLHPNSLLEQGAPRGPSTYVGQIYPPLPAFPFIQQHFAKWDPHVGGLLCNSSEGFLPALGDLCPLQMAPGDPVANGQRVCSMFTLSTWTCPSVRCPPPPARVSGNNMPSSRASTFLSHAREQLHWKMCGFFNIIKQLGSPTHCGTVPTTSYVVKYIDFLHAKKFFV